MSEAISQATYMPQQPMRGAQRAPGAAKDADNGFGNALDAPADRARTVDDTLAEETAGTARDDEEQVGDDEHEDGSETGKFVNILAMTGSGHWSFRFPGDAAKDGGGDAKDGGGATSDTAANAIDGKKHNAAGDGPATPVEGQKTAAPPKAGGDAGADDEGSPAQTPAARGTEETAAKAEAETPMRAGDGRHAGQLAAVLAEAGQTHPSKAAPHADAPARAASDGRAGAIAEALRQQGADNDPAAGNKGGHDGEAGSGQGRAGPEAQAGDAAMPKVKVLGVQNAPAPVAAAAPTVPGASQTGAELVKSLHSDPAFRAATTEAAAQANASARPEVMHSLKLQLQPASMGTVTATMRLVGEHLTVEIQTDNANAHHRLGTDSDSMAKALRALGYDVDRVIVHQAAATHHGAGPDTQTGGGARQNAFQSTGGDTGEGAASQGGERGHDGQQNHAGADRGRAQPQADSSRNGLYI